MKHSIPLVSMLFVTLLFACNSSSTTSATAAKKPGPVAAVSLSVKLYSVATRGYIMSEKVIKTNEEWRKLLTPAQYHVTREKGTEPAFSSASQNNHEKGTYQCICCGNDLYSSEHKFESGTGWPSFWQPIAPENVAERADNSLFTRRTEVVCARCDAHLGHVFNDGPKPTGLRYCMNAVAMKFVKAP